MAYSTLLPGHVLVGFKESIVKYERDDNDIVPLRVKDEDHLWAGANPEPAGDVNDLDSVRNVKGAKRRLGTRARGARFTGMFTVTGNDGIAVEVRVEKTVPVLTKAAFGTGAFAPRSTVNGKACLLRVGLPGGTQVLSTFDVVFTLTRLIAEVNV